MMEERNTVEGRGTVDALIIGSGPAGYTAAIYLGRAGFAPLVVAGALTPGGQLVNTTEVENYPGFPDGVMGPELMESMRRQAERFGSEFVYDDVVSVDFGGAFKTVTLASGRTIRARAVIVATGSQVRKLGVPGEEEYSGRGVSYCATCDGFFFKDKPIVVVGGGDSAMEEADFLSRFGSSVTLIHRRDEFRASKIMLDRVRDNPKITILTNTVVTAVRGSGVAPAGMPSVSAPSLELRTGLKAASSGRSIGLASNANAGGPAIGLGLALSKPTDSVASIDIRDTVSGRAGTMPVNGLFVAIGHTPATGFLTGQVAMDDDGYVLVEGAGTRTSTPGVFAAGDCVDRVYRQAISAAGMGCRAALDAQAYLTA
ncbi:thioredoxin reductase [Bifidobacterium lemurum]|uniref:Thioredoxin reductase n=2 Tax=Bifidobacterium lemurum TaxID=1603886 RepID=A0A261FTL1_9BIFI|nr:thioredoxin reductase [Bifidobacterium lemurum]